jgi:hypothetical protein
MTKMLAKKPITIIIPITLLFVVIPFSKLMNFLPLPERIKISQNNNSGFFIFGH